jgi:hypothetical protein
METARKETVAHCPPDSTSHSALTGAANHDRSGAGLHGFGTC